MKGLREGGGGGVERLRTRLEAAVDFEHIPS